MENHSHSSFHDSRNSSPSSHDVDNENPPWDEPPTGITTNNNHKVKFMCSYGGNVQFRPHDNQLAYVGGDTKIITVDRNIKFSAIMAKLSSLCNGNVDIIFKYQLPGEDLDALISVTNDEDLEHMMAEYDQCLRASAKPARLRLFLFPPNPSASANFGPSNLKPEQQWFVDALNSVHIPHVEVSSPSATVSAKSPDFLFGLDNRYSVVPAAKMPDSVSPPPSNVPHAAAKDAPGGTDGGSEDRQVVGEPAVSPTKIQKPIEELQRLHFGNNEQILQRESDEGNGRFNTTVDVYNSQKNPEKPQPPPAQSGPAPVSIPAPAGVYLPERHMASAGYSLAASATVTEQPLYLIATPAVMYHATTLRAVTGPVGQPYYGVPRMVPAAEFYNGAPSASLSISNSHSQSIIGAKAETTGTVPTKVGVAEPGYVQVVYDSSGRQIYFAAPAWGGMVPPYQEVTAGADGTQGGGGAVNQDPKVPKAASAVIL